MGKVETKYWLIGVVMLIVLIVFDRWLSQTSGITIVDHQGAGSAAKVDAIQKAWKEVGHFGFQTAGMVGDLIFICVYSFGTWRAGVTLRAQAGGVARVIGAVVMGSALVFFLSDMVETILQLAQMILGAGVKWMAETAAMAQPIKFLSWTLSFFAVIAGLIAARFSAKPA